MNTYKISNERENQKNNTNAFQEWMKSDSLQHDRITNWRTETYRGNEGNMER
jgi:hypothetical protein